MAMWCGNKKDGNIGQILSGLVKNVQKNAKKLQDDTEKLKANLNKMKIKLSDEEISNYAPVLFKLMNDGADEAEIKKTVKQLKSQINESVRKSLMLRHGPKQLIESKFLITESEHMEFIFEAVCQNDMILEAMTENLIREGWFGDKFAKLKNSKLAAAVKQKTAQLKTKLANAGSKSL